MKEAITRSIYYINEHPQNPIISIEYSDKKSFNESISSLSKKIETVAAFAPKGDKVYSIFEKLAGLYDDLLLDKVNSLYLINRRDVSICLYKSVKNEEAKPSLIAILKIDAILAEYKPSLPYHYLFPLLLSYPIYKLYQNFRF
jgi:hypothetical protein